MKNIFALLILIISSLPLSAASNADFIVVIDQSRSIKKNLPAIKDFVSKRIFGSIAHSDDRVHLLSFDGQLYDREVLNGDADVFEIGYALDDIKATGGYTDLTNAVVKMSSYISKKTDPKSRKIIFFLTDGLNEPPAYSPYSTELNHDFFSDSIEQRQKGGWKLLILGLGEKTNAPELAAILQADYIQLSEHPTLLEFDEHITEKLHSARKSFPLPIAIAGTVFALALGGGTAAFMLHKGRSNGTA